MSFIPTVISTTFNHYTRGPPQPSWGLKFHLSFKIFKSMVNDSANKTIEQVQESTNLPIPIPDGVTTRESKIDNKYRLESQVQLDKILKPYEHVLDLEWKDGFRFLMMDGKQEKLGKPFFISMVGLTFLVVKILFAKLPARLLRKLMQDFLVSKALP